jgi:pyruvate/2-oxoglutarate dehydrogenase complex dihydrolipoamide dehydrogenase (E3) component
MMAAANRTWGEERIAAELLVKLGIRVSLRERSSGICRRDDRARNREHKHGVHSCGTTVVRNNTVRAESSRSLNVAARMARIQDSEQSVNNLLPNTG